MPDCKTETVGYFLRPPGYSGDNSKTGVQKYRNEHPDEATNGSKIGLWTLLAGLGVGAIGGIGYKTSDGNQSWGTVGILGALAALAGAGLKIYSYTSALVPETSDASKANPEKKTENPDSTSDAIKERINTAKDKNKKPEVRIKAIEEIEEQEKIKEASKDLLAILNDTTDNEYVRSYALLALVSTSNCKEEDLYKHLDDKSKLIRYGALLQLSENKAIQDIAGGEEKLIKILKSDECVAVQAAAARHLEGFSSNESLSALLEALKTEKKIENIQFLISDGRMVSFGDPEKEIDFREIVLDALGVRLETYENQNCITEILLCLEDNSITSKAEEVLVEMKKQTAIDKLASYLTDTELTIRSNTARILGVRKEIDKTNELLTCLDDSNQIVRTEAAIALCNIYSDFDKINSIEKAAKAREVLDKIKAKSPNTFVSQSLEEPLDKLSFISAVTDPEFEKQINLNKSPEDFLLDYTANDEEKEILFFYSLLWLDSIYENKKQKSEKLSNEEGERAQFVKECLIYMGDKFAEKYTANDFINNGLVHGKGLTEMWTAETLARKQDPTCIEPLLAILQSNDQIKLHQFAARALRFNHSTLPFNLASFLIYKGSLGVQWYTNNPAIEEVKKSLSSQVNSGTLKMLESALADNPAKKDFEEIEKGITTSLKGAAKIETALQGANLSEEESSKLVRQLYDIYGFELLSNFSKHPTFNTFSPNARKAILSLLAEKERGFFVPDPNSIEGLIKKAKEGDKETIELFINNFLTKEEEEEKDSARRALVEIGTPVVRPLIEEQHINRSYLRKQTEEVIIAIGEPAVPILEACLDDQRETVVKMARKLLATIKPEQYDENIIKLDERLVTKTQAKAELREILKGLDKQITSFGLKTIDVLNGMLTNPERSTYINFIGTERINGIIRLMNDAGYDQVGDLLTKALIDKESLSEDSAFVVNQLFIQILSEQS